MNLLLLTFLVWIAAVPWLLFPGAFPYLTVLFLFLLAAIRLYTGWRWGRVMVATPLNGLVLVYLFLSGLALLLAPFPAEALPKLTTLLLGVFGYLFVLDWLWPPASGGGQIADNLEIFPTRLTRLACFLAIAGGAIALGTLPAVEWPQRQLWDITALTNRIPHLTGSFSVHPNEIAGTLLFLLPFALFLGWFPDDAEEIYRWPVDLRWIKVLGRLLLISMLVGLILMQSRVALLALVAVIVLYVGWGRWRLRWLLAIGVAGGLLLFFSGTLLGVKPGQVAAWISEVDVLSKQGDLAPQSWPMRLEIWSAAGQMLNDYPVFGSGLDSFVPVSRANYPYFAIPTGLDFAHAHSLWLQAGAEMGWPGILATILLLMVPLGGLWLAARPDRPGWRMWTTPFGASLAGYMLFNLLDTISPMQRPGVLFWVILAGSAAIMARSGVFGRRIHFVALVPLGLLVLLLFTPLARQNRANWQLDQARFFGSPLPEQAALLAQRQCVWLAHRQEWAAAETCFAGRPDAVLFLQSQGRQAAYAGRPEEALTWYNVALALDNTAASVYYWRGQLYEKGEAFTLAQADYEQAVRYAEDQGLSRSWQALFHYSLGRAYVREQSWSQALQHFQAAVALDDTQPLYFEALGDMFLVFGDKTGAQDAYERAGKR